MDMHMPVMDGLEAAAIILGLNTGIPVVAMTANIMSDDQEVYRKSGMVDYVGKPFTSQELWRCLMKFFTPISWKKEDITEQALEENKLKNRLIKSFLRNNKDIYRNLTNALDLKEFKLAHRLVHTLKSNAAQLDKALLAQAAEEIEECLHNRSNQLTTQQMDKLKSELDVVIAEFEQVTSNTKDQKSDETKTLADVNDALNLIDELESLLKDNNTDCVEYIDKLDILPGSDMLIQQIEEFDFPAALETLTEIKANLT